MNDEIEHPPNATHRATQPGCRHWAPITQALPEGKDVPAKTQVNQGIASDPMPVIEKPTA